MIILLLKEVRGRGEYEVFSVYCKSHHFLFLFRRSALCNKENQNFLKSSLHLFQGLLSFRTLLSEFSMNETTLGKFWIPWSSSSFSNCYGVLVSLPRKKIRLKFLFESWNNDNYDFVHSICEFVKESDDIIMSAEISYCRLPHKDK